MGAAAPGHRLVLSAAEYSLLPPGPYDTFRSALCPGGRLPRVPVLHAFGVDEHGARCCYHVHNVFPYLYIEYTELLEPQHGRSVHSCSAAVH